MEEVVQWVASGQCVVYPTSTLPALGCIPEASSLDTLFSIKNRASSMPVSIGVVDLEQASGIVEIPEDVPEILAAFPMGSLTIILRALEKMDPELRKTLKKAGHLRRDPRKKERKKTGQPGARKRFQFSKR